MTEFRRIETVSPYEHVIATQQFDLEFLADVFQRADHFRNKEKQRRTALNRKGYARDDLEGWNVLVAFYEPSTRTRFSFEVAARNLGAMVTSSDSMNAFSSAKKGESIEHTVKTLSQYGHILVMRFGNEGDAIRAAKASDVPVINAGEAGHSPNSPYNCQHPTQALLDLYTILNETGGLSDKTIAFVGDLKHGRTSNSLAYLFGKIEECSDDVDQRVLEYLGIRRGKQNNKLLFVAPDICQVGSDILRYLDSKGVSYEVTGNLDTALASADATYMLRTQLERIDDQDEAREIAGKYRIDNSNIHLLRERGIIMHPLPVDSNQRELDDGVEYDAKSRVFDQVLNGLVVRMGLLKAMRDYREKQIENGS